MEKSHTEIRVVPGQRITVINDGHGQFHASISAPRGIGLPLARIDIPKGMKMENGTIVKYLEGLALNHGLTLRQVRGTSHAFDLV